MPGAEGKERTKGAGLALSGGGFRATLFHIGSLWRLNELGWFKKLSEVTSVSGGSITAAYLGLRWKHLSFENDTIAVNFVDQIVRPLREFCSHTLDIGSVVAGVISPFRHPSALVASQYRKRLFGSATLQDLPADAEGPRFTIYATNLQTGASVRFSRPYLAEYHLGMIASPDVELAVAVAASSAFPPVLCPVKLKRKPESWDEVEGADLFGDRKLQSTLLLGDGGIYDNLGLERIWDRYGTVLVSDAGAPFTLLKKTLGLRLSQVCRTKRALDIIGEQALALRRRWLVGNLVSGKISGAYWGIATQIHKYGYGLEERGCEGPLVGDSDMTRSLAKMRTRLNRFTDEEQERLINWGYALTDAAMRQYVLEAGVPCGQLPYPQRTMQ